MDILYYTIINRSMLFFLNFFYL